MENVIEIFPPFISFIICSLAIALDDSTELIMGCPSLSLAYVITPFGEVEIVNPVKKERSVFILSFTFVL